MRTRWIVTVQLLVLAGGLSAAQVEPQSDSKFVKALKVRWSSVRYNRSVVVENPETAKGPSQEPQSLTLACQVDVLDPNLIWAVSQEFVVTQLIDSKGRDIAVGTAPARSRNSYEGLRYIRQPLAFPSPPRWRTVLRTIMQLPPPVPAPGRTVLELQPCRMTVQLDEGLLDRAGGELRTVRGYFHAIVPGSTEQVEVPFEPNNAWIRLTPDTEIQLQEAVSENMSFRYKIEARPPAPSHALWVGQGVPERCIIAQEFIGEDGKPVRQLAGLGGFPVRVGGWGNGSGTRVRPIKSIRYVIGVDAREYRIPFELERVPLPKP